MTVVVDMPELPAPRPPTGEARFFRADDGPADFWFVARDLEHAKRLLVDAGCDYVMDANGVVLGPDREDAGPLEWSEITRDEAMKVNCNTNDVNRGRGSVKLAECDLGEWFSSEW